MAKVSKKEIEQLQVALDKAGVHKEIAKLPRTTVASRRAQLVRELEELNEARIDQLRTELAGYIDLVLSPLGDEAELTDEYAFVLVRQALATRNLKDVFGVIHEKIKEAAFVHFNAHLAREGYEDPENTNDELKVEALGVSLRREGAGRQDAVLDEDKLKEGLGELWEKVYTRTVIPERVVHELDHEALWDLVKDNPALLQVVGESLTPGAPKSARLNLRNLTEE